MFYDRAKKPKKTSTTRNNGNIFREVSPSRDTGNTNYIPSSRAHDEALFQEQINKADPEKLAGLQAMFKESFQRQMAEINAYKAQRAAQEKEEDPEARMAQRRSVEAGLQPASLEKEEEIPNAQGKLIQREAPEEKEEEVPSAQGKLIQPKLTVGPPGDKYEQEADRVADSVVNAPEAQRATGNTPEDESVKTALQPTPKEEEISKKTATEDEKSVRAGLKPAPVSTSTESAIESARGGGKSLSENDRAFYESRMGADFSNVKIHTGGQAGELARSINARAFTVGSDIFFGSGEYNSSTTEGKKLMAHELTHTVQQGASGKGKVQRKEGELPGDVDQKSKTHLPAYPVLLTNFFENVYDNKKYSKEQVVENFCQNKAKLYNALTNYHTRLRIYFGKVFHTLPVTTREMINKELISCNSFKEGLIDECSKYQKLTWGQKKDKKYHSNQIINYLGFIQKGYEKINVALNKKR